MKKVVYQITRKRYELVAVETLEQEELIKRIKQRFWNRTKTMGIRCVAHDYLYEKKCFELVDNSTTGEEAYFERLEKELSNKKIYDALNIVTIYTNDHIGKEQLKEINNDLGNESVNLLDAKIMRILLNCIKVIDKHTVEFQFNCNLNIIEKL